MKHVFFFMALAVSHCLFDINLFKVRRRETVTVPIAFHIGDEKQKLKTRKFSRKGGKYRRPQKYAEKHFKFSSSRPRDHRYSNQRTLRRMFRNY